MWAPTVTHGGFSASQVEEIKRAVSIPVITVGRYTEPQFAELMVKEGRCDLVAFGRQSLADPYMPLKALSLIGVTMFAAILAFILDKVLYGKGANA